MIQLECDNCEKTFEVSPDDGGTKVPCPHCGDVNRIPEARSPEGQGLPLSDGVEEDILVFRPAMFRARPFLFLLMLGLIGGGIAVVIWSFMGGGEEVAVAADVAGDSDAGGGGGTTNWKLYLGGVMAILGGLWWGGWYLSHLTRRIRITNKRTISRTGLLSKHTSEVLHSHVRNLQIRQSIWQRIVNTGSITLDSSAGGGEVSAEITVNDIPRPARIKEIIDQYREL